MTDPTKPNYSPFFESDELNAVVVDPRVGPHVAIRSGRVRDPESRVVKIL